jgi:hypothetical protein
MSYTTTDRVRAILPGLLQDDDDLGTVNSGAYISLNNPAFDVPTIEKDGTVLTKDTDYVFTRPLNIVLIISANGEQYIAQCYYGISEDDLTNIISIADRIIDDYFYQYDGPGADYQQDWSSWLSAAIYLKQYCIATEENLTKADRLEKMAMDAMKAYRENTLYNSPTKINVDHDFVYKVNA